MTGELRPTGRSSSRTSRKPGRARPAHPAGRPLTAVLAAIPLAVGLIAASGAAAAASPPGTPGPAGTPRPATARPGAAAASTARGTLRGWGNGTDGKLGDGGTKNRRTPVKVRLPRGTTVTSVRGGCSQTYALTSAGQVLAWGLGFSGELGDGSRATRHTPVRVKLPKGTKVKIVRAGCDNGLALTPAGHVLAWGVGDQGQLGTGTKRDHLRPVRVALPKGTKVKAISAGCGHGLALTTAGNVLAWGLNGSGQLGIGSRHDRLRPVRVKLPGGTKFKAVTAGCNDSFAVSSSGQVFAWGSNDFGELGDGSTTERDTPVKISVGPPETSPRVPHAPIPKPTAIFAGCHHTIALLAGGHLVLAWGENVRGELGDGSFGGNSTHPVRVLVPSSTTIKAISAGCDDGLALTTAGRVLAWGDNMFGELGNGKRGNSDVPVRVHLAAGLVATAIGAGPTAVHDFAIVHLR